jgi:DNA-directed RNA polymerase specialized sigma24 family protein
MDPILIQQEITSTFYELCTKFDITYGVYLLIYIKRKLYPLVKYRLVRHLKRTGKPLELESSDGSHATSIHPIQESSFDWAPFLERMRCRLGDLYSDVVFLRYLFGLTQEDIGQIVGVSQVAIGSYLSKAYNVVRRDPLFEDLLSR